MRVESSAENVNLISRGFVIFPPTFLKKGRYKGKLLKNISVVVRPRSNFGAEWSCPNVILY